ncbi:MAG: hypothetical protein QM689_06860 [Oscillospiraceae bacterium]
MGKKDRLRKQKEKQNAEQKARELQEAALREAPAPSRAAKKLRKSESRAYLLLKLIMTAPYLWSVLFCGGITLIAVRQEILSTDTEVAKSVNLHALTVLTLVGVALFTVVYILSWLRLYITAFVVSLPAMATFLSAANKIITPVKNYIAQNAVDPAYQHADRHYMLAYYPAALITLIAFGCALMKTLTLLHARRAEKNRAPQRAGQEHSRLTGG